MIRYEPLDDVGSIRLSGAIGVAEAVELRDALAEAIAHSRVVAVQATELQHADASVLQLLIAAGHTCRNQGKDWRIQPSIALLEVANQAGLEIRDRQGWSAEP